MGNRTQAGEDHSIPQPVKEALSRVVTFGVHVALMETRHAELVLDARYILRISNIPVTGVSSFFIQLA